MGEWVTEAEALSDMYEDGDFGESKARERESVVHTMMRRYREAKNADTGTTIHCPCCNRAILKNTYNKVFCANQKTKGKRGQKNSCKDRYWNQVNPRGKFEHLG